MASGYNKLGTQEAMNDMFVLLGGYDENQLGWHSGFANIDIKQCRGGTEDA